MLVANLGHNPLRWWRRVLEYLDLPESRRRDDQFASMLPLTAYNAVTELEVTCCERLVANMRNQPGGDRMQQRAVGCQRQRGDPEIALGLDAPAAGTRHDSVNPPRVPRQKGLGRRGDGQRA